MNDKHENSHSPADQSWFEKPGNQKLLITLLLIACALTLITQMVFPMFDEKHPPHFEGYEDFLGFQAIFGFVAFVVIVYLGKLLRPIVMRKEDYYDQ